MKVKKALKRLVKADIALSEVITEFTDIDQAAHDLLVSARLDVARAKEILVGAKPAAVAEEEPPLEALPAAKKKVRRKPTPERGK